MGTRDKDKMVSYKGSLSEVKGEEVAEMMTWDYTDYVCGITMFITSSVC